MGKADKGRGLGMFTRRGEEKRMGDSGCKEEEGETEGIA